MQSCGEFPSVRVCEPSRRSAVAWFLGQSLLFIVLAFVLGLLVGWLIWGRRRVVQMSFSSASPAPAIPASSALDSTVDYGASSTVDERTSPLGDADAATVVLPYAVVPPSAEGERVAGSAADSEATVVVANLAPSGSAAAGGVAGSESVPAVA